MLIAKTEATPGYTLTVDLPAQQIALTDGQAFGFEIAPFLKEALLAGDDAIGITLKQRDAIEDFEQQRFAQFPWLSNQSKPAQATLHMPAQQTTTAKAVKKFACCQATALARKWCQG